ncbi:MAG: TetR/AcrR family transcriptional regulator [Rhodobacteraceae bacterium]|nr:TetR/AcrR family transcriptional regulator [Paracoccaceae bacterium]
MPQTLALPETDFAAVLRLEADGKRKSDRTRAGLMAATCELLSNASPDALRVSDICAKAGVAHGTFYVYFSDIRALLDALLQSFVAHVQHAMHAVGKAQPGDRVRATNALYVALFERNPGLMRCLVSSFDSFPEAAARFQALNHAWAKTVAEAAGRRLARSGQSVPKDELLRRAHALGGMVDQYLVTLHFNRDAALADLSRDREEVIDTLTFIWNRGLGI